MKYQIPNMQSFANTNILYRPFQDLLRLYNVIKHRLFEKNFTERQNLLLRFCNLPGSLRI